MMDYSASELLLTRPAAILENFIKKEVGIQKTTRILSTKIMKRIISSRNNGKDKSISLPIVPKKDAIIPMTARVANETMPVLVTFFSKRSKFIIDEIIGSY